MNYKVNKFGRSYVSGTSLSLDVRRLVIDKILLEGGDRVTGFFPSTFSKIATDLNITIPTVSKIWKQFCDTYDEMPLSRGGDFNKKLDDGDLELIEVLKMANGSISLKELYSELEQFGNVGGNITISSISRAIKSRLLSGKRYTRKKISRVATERFTYSNMLYTQIFIDYLSSKDVGKIKFFDEAGVKVPDVGTRMYGHAPQGERCVEVVRKKENLNSTLNMLVSVNGPEYYNVIDGATNTVEFLTFFKEAANATNITTQ